MMLKSGDIRQLEILVCDVCGAAVVVFYSEEENTFKGHIIFIEVNE